MRIMKDENNLVWAETEGDNLIDYIRCRKSGEGLENRLSIERYDADVKQFLISIGEKEFYLGTEDMKRIVNFINKVL